MKHASSRLELGLVQMDMVWFSNPISRAQNGEDVIAKAGDDNVHAGQH